MVFGERSAQSRKSFGEGQDLCRTKETIIRSVDTLYAEMLGLFVELVGSLGIV